MNNEFWDSDIAKMSLSNGQKDGLQVYRNYASSFTEDRKQKFIEKINNEAWEWSGLELIISQVISEDPRFLPVIACAYADDVLKDMLKAIVPDGIPGGKKSLFGPYGPFSNISSCIKMAFVFDVTSKDLLTDLDILRGLRNSIAHGWSPESIESFLNRSQVSLLSNIDHLRDQREDITDLLLGISQLAAFRIRLIWFLGRIAYEAPLYWRAKQELLSPSATLYGKTPSSRLTITAKLAYEATIKVRQLERGSM